MLPAFAFALALALYSPWIAVLQSQTAEVRGGYWIPLLDEFTLRETFFSWLTGVRHVPTFVGWLYAAAALGIVVAICCRRPVQPGTGCEPAAAPPSLRGVWLLVLLAIVPWLLCLAFSLWGGAPILQIRYLAFAQLALFGLYGVGLSLVTTSVGNALRGVPRAAHVALPVALAAFVLVPIVLDAISAAASRTNTADGIRGAVTAIKEQMQTNAVVLVSRPGEVNRVRFYLHQAGLDHLPVLCRASPFTHGQHTPHLGSLTTDDLLYDELPPEISTCWRLAVTSETAASAPPHLNLQWDRVYGSALPFRLALYDRGP